MFKNGLNTARDQFDNAIYDISFHIAGREKNEVPEKLLFATKIIINKIWTNAQNLDEQYINYVSENQMDDEDDLYALYPIGMDWLLRYNWGFRILCVINLLWSLLDVLY